ncbi:hypothetical protein EYR36_009956 [Pleurotus pulmonarius]|nr:hypothetical protein EYR36_009956 [Pleurotus pulmonarius]KAF4593434.1 hypothetical protein EYR38_009148 [Pleurotus pulmonarius]
MTTQTQLGTEAHRERLLKMDTYLGRTGGIRGLEWCVSNGQKFVMKRYRDSEWIEPAEFLLVGQVRYETKSLGPLGTYNPNSKTRELERAKIVFFLEKPSDPGYGKDYVSGVRILKDLQKAGGEHKVQKDMLQEQGPTTFVRLVVSLFRSKEWEEEEQDVPEEEIEDDPSKPSYYPTAYNWPYESKHSSAFEEKLATHIFQPFNAFNLNKGRINPKDYRTFLPGCLVEVKFTIHAWHFSGNDSFNAEVVQLLVLRPKLPNMPAVSSPKKKKFVKGITYPNEGKIAGPSGSSDENSQKKRTFDKVNDKVDTGEGSDVEGDDEVCEMTAPKKARLEDADEDSEEEVVGKGKAKKEE